MAKRRFPNYEDEENDDSEELDRFLASGPPLDADRPLSILDSESEEEDLGDDGSDATFEDNADGVDATKVGPQFSILVSQVSSQLLDSVHLHH